RDHQPAGAELLPPELEVGRRMKERAMGILHDRAGPVGRMERGGVVGKLDSHGGQVVQVSVVRRPDYPDTAWGDWPVARPSLAPDRASCRTSQASTAHLMRTGYFTTPLSATRSPKASSVGSTSPPSMARTRAARASASPTELPATDSVSIEALAWLMEHPDPSNVTSAICPSSRCAFTVISSPHRGLFFEQDTSAPGRARLFLGFL